MQWITQVLIISLFFVSCKQSKLIGNYVESQAESVFIPNTYRVQFGGESSTLFNFSGSTSDTTKDMVVDSNGNVYIVGYTDGSFGVPYTSTGNGFFAKINKFGTVLFVKNFETNDLKAVKIDSQGYIYVTGETSSSLGETNGGGTDAFIAKLNQYGEIIKTAQFGLTTGGASSSGDETVEAMTIDSENNIIITGSTTGDLDDTNGLNDPGGFCAGENKDIFVLKFDSSLAFVWKAHIGRSKTGGIVNDVSGDDIPKGVVTDTSDNVYVTGESACDFTETNGNAFGSWPAEDIVIAKFTSSGTLSLANHLGNDTYGAAVNYDEDVYSMSIDSNNNIYVTGGTFGSLGDTAGNLDTTRDVFIVKFNASTLAATTIYQFGNTNVSTLNSNSNDEFSKDIFVDAQNNLHIVGYTNSNFIETRGGAFGDAFYLKLDSSFAVLKSKQLGLDTIGTTAVNTETGDAVFVDSNKNVYFSGSTQGHLFETHLNPSADDDFFLIKMDSNLRF